MGEAWLRDPPLTRDRWDDLVTLFDRPGDPKGCWCMFWRVRGPFEKLWGRAQARPSARWSRRARRPALAYRDGAPVGWCAVAPERSPVLRSRVLGPTDSDPACWAVVCFYVVKDERRGGVAAALLEAAVAFAADHGATTVEGYPKDTDGRPQGRQRDVRRLPVHVPGGGVRARRPATPPPGRSCAARSKSAAAPAGAR